MTLLLLVPPASEPLIEWPDAVMEFVGFLAWFAAIGALGFRFVVLRGGGPRDGSDGSDGSDAPAVFDVARRNAAGIGLIGALLMVGLQVVRLAGQAAEKHQGLVETAQKSGARFLVPFVCAVVLLVAYAAATKMARVWWEIAAVAAIVLVFNGITGGWTRLINPVHRAAASLWLGTLFVVLTAGLPAILRGAQSPDARGALVAGMVRRFSPLALTAAAFLALTGVITAWRHLHVLSSLWTTPYGYALDVKLALVLCVVGLGAWNWRRMVPQLGSEDAAHALRRSAKAELIFAGLVLVVTAILVSLPSPRPPGH
jgi:copper transport protein